MKAQPGEEKRNAAPEKKSGGRGPVVIIVVIVVILGLIFGIKEYTYASTHESTDDALVDADLVVVTSKISERVNSINVQTNSFVHKGDIVAVLDDRDERRRLTQAVTTLNAMEAQLGAANANVDLTSATQAAQVQQGNGGVAQAMAGIASAEQQVSQSKDELSVAHANVVTAQAQLRSAQALSAGAAATYARTSRDLTRIERLAHTGDAPVSDLDAARATEANAFAQKQQADANIAVAEATLTSAQDHVSSQQSAITAANENVNAQNAMLSSAQGKLAEASTPYRVSTQRSSAGANLAQVASQKSAVALAKDQLDYTVIRAPIDGYLGEKDVEVGKTVAPGETIMTIVPSRDIYITANFKETQIGHIRPGQRVEVTVDAYGSREFTGHVAQMPPASQATYSLIPAQNSTGNFVKVTQRLPVRIYVDQGIDDAHPLRVGMSVEAAVEIK